MQWLLDHSEVTSANPEFVWRYCSEVENWSDPPASFVLHGPFESGTRGETHFPGREPIAWVLREVRPREGYTMESDLEGAGLLCEWSFSADPDGGTTLRQRVGIHGPSAAAQAEGVRAAFGASLEDGMKRIAQNLDRAHCEASKERPST